MTRPPGRRGRAGKRPRVRGARVPRGGRVRSSGCALYLFAPAAALTQLPLLLTLLGGAR